MIPTELKRRAAWLIAALALMGAFGALYISTSQHHSPVLAEDGPKGGG
jgi:hypothetical protein